ncbi:MAG: SIR2 family protein, partial [Bacteroidota bacterium]
NWGTSLGNLAQAKGGEEAERLYAQAFEKFAEAVRIKPDKHEALNNWGTSLGNLAQAKGGEEAERLYAQAFEKFAEAVRIKPDKHEALYNWGTSLGKLAQAKGGEEAERLYAQAFEKFAEAVKAGGSSYNLACLYAIRGHKTEALSALNHSLSNNEILVDFVLADEDWSEYLIDPDFKTLVDSFRP